MDEFSVTVRMFADGQLVQLEEKMGLVGVTPRTCTLRFLPLPGTDEWYEVVITRDLIDLMYHAQNVKRRALRNPRDCECDPQTKPQKDQEEDQNG